MKVSDLALEASNVLLGTAVGAGVDQSLFLMRGWSALRPTRWSPRTPITR
jgi:hypothetical protein